jgi:hypothetical protein
VRISTGKRDLEEAKTVARDQYLDYKFRSKHDLPIVTKRFEDVAKLAIADMQKQLDAGAGRKVFKDYIKAALLRKGLLRDSSRESSVVAGLHEQTDPAELQDQELAGLQ